MINIVSDESVGPLEVMFIFGEGDFARDCVGTSSTIGGGGRGRNIFVPVSGGNGTKIAPPRDILDQPPGHMR